MQAEKRHLEATHFLSQIDDDWANLIQQVGTCTFAPNQARAPYEALIRAVAFQQLHAKAGEAILQRLCNLNHAFPTPHFILTTKVDALRACGFSARKIETLQQIAQGAVDGRVPSWQQASEMPDEALITQLTELKGIGRWTVEMLLMFNLGRLDILPVNDFAILEGYKRLKKLASAPKPKEMTAIGQAWQPHRTIASWYLWRVPKD